VESEGGFRRLLDPRRVGRVGSRAPAARPGDEAATAGAGFGPSAGGRPVSTSEAPIREVSVRAAAPAAEVARVLVGQAHAAREARIELGGGLFAGSTIHLAAAAGGGLEVRLGAPTEAVRLALASALDRVGHHLRSRGIVMRPGAPLDTGSRQSRRDGRPR
jgi:hypothetical protein